MIKKYIYLVNIILIIIILFVSLLLFKRFYFNEFYYKVPNLVGLNYEVAEKTIKSSDLRIRDMGETYSNIPYGYIALQDPVEGSIVKKNRNIKVWRSMSNPLVYLNELTNMNYLDAVVIAEKNGMVIGEITKINSSLPMNYVIATSPKTGEPMARGTKISFILSNGNGYENN